MVKTDGCQLVCAAKGTGEQEGRNDYVSLSFRSWDPSGREYQGVDMELMLELTSIHWDCHRATLASLITFGNDMSFATGEGAVAKEVQVSTGGGIRRHILWPEEAALPETVFVVSGTTAGGL